MPAPTGATAEQMRALWLQATELTKQRAVNPTLYRALEKTIPIAWEDNTFVVGVDGADGLMTGALNTAEYQVITEKALRDLTRNPQLKYRFIEGNDYSDWEYTKQRDAAILENQAVSAQKQASVSSAINNWDDLLDNIARLWPQIENRNTAIGRGRYLSAALAMVADAMDQLYPAEGKAEDAVERGLSRVLERIATMTQSDPAMLAYLLVEKRKKAG